MVDSCPDNVLNDMVRIKQRQLSGDHAKATVKTYRRCARDGFCQAMRILGYRFKNQLLPRLNKIIAVHEKPAK